MRASPPEATASAVKGAIDDSIPLSAQLTLGTRPIVRIEPVSSESRTSVQLIHILEHEVRMFRGNTAERACEERSFHSMMITAGGNPSTKPFIGCSTSPSTYWNTPHILEHEIRKIPDAASLHCFFPPDRQLSPRPGDNGKGDRIVFKRHPNDPASPSTYWNTTSPSYYFFASFSASLARSLTCGASCHQPKTPGTLSLV